MFIGPSYGLRSRTADVQRAINLIPLPIEPGNTRTQWRFKDVPGLIERWNLGAEIRGGINCLGRVLVVAGNTLYELFSDYTSVSRGALYTSTGVVGMVFNTTQVAVADDSNLYVLTRATNVFASVPGYPGGAVIQYVNQYVLFINRGSQQFGWTALGDVSSIDALDFASAEGSPDNLVSIVVDHLEAIMLGTNSVETFVNTGTTSVFERRSGAFGETGCAAAATAVKLDSSVFWLGSDERGQGVVWRLANGYDPVRVSTQAIEELMQGLDLSGARAYAYQMDGSAFYCLQVPALNTTWCFDAMTRQWHERAELVSGDYAKHRGNVHVFAFNKHLLGDASGRIYSMDPAVSNNAGDVLVRDRVMPDAALPSKVRQAFSRFVLDCDKGSGATAQLRYSNDGGASWSGWIVRGLHAVGNLLPRVKWVRLGSARDRVWHLRCTDDAPLNPIAAYVETEQ